MASSDAKPIPVKNTAYRITFPIYDADGDLVTGATGLDSEVSKDAGTFADCTNEATEIATSSGVYYLDLTSTEMNADTVCVIIKTSTSGAKTTVVVLNPQEAGDVNTTVEGYASGQVPLQPTTAGRTLDVTATGAAGIDWGNVENPTTTLNLSATTVKTLTDAPSDSSGTTTLLSRLTSTRAGYIDNLSGGAVMLASSYSAPPSAATIADAVWDEDIVSAHTTINSAGWSLSHVHSTIDVLNGYITVAPPTAAAIADAVWDEVISGHATSGSTGEALSAAGSAGDPWSTALPGAYSAGSAGYIIGTNLNATVGSRSSHSAADVWGVATRTLSAFAFTVTTSDAASIAAILEDTGTTLPAQISGLSIPSAATNASAVRAELETELARLDVATSTRLASASYTAPDNASITAILEDTGATIPAQIAALSIPTTTQIADAVLSRNVSSVEGSAGEHTLCTLVLAGLESSVSGTTWTIKRTDGTTTHATKTVATDANADPVTGVS